MPSIEIFNSINKVQKEAISQHNDMSNFFDFLGLHGFKRLHEYRMLCEKKTNIKLNKWFINHKGMLLSNEVVADQNIIPKEVFAATSDKVDEAEICKYTKQLFEYYGYKLKAELSFYSDSVAKLMTEGDIEGALKIQNCVWYVADELKRCNRLAQQLRNSAYSSIVILQMQDELHSKYKEKMC